jgi:protein involved in polysaccharide export with SLBB domain
MNTMRRNAQIRPHFLSLVLLMSAAAAWAGGESNMPPATLEPHDSVSFRIAEDQVDPQESAEPKTLTVTDSGGLEVPYIGVFPVAGKTCQQAAEEIKSELEKKYYFTATVIMSVQQKAKTVGACYVSGQVHQTGAVELPGGQTLTLSQAVVRAGGFTEYADKHHVRLTRRLEAGINSQTRTVDLTRVIEEGKAEQDIPLEPGDSVFVPSKLLNF